MDNAEQYKIRKSFVVRFGKGYGIFFLIPQIYLYYKLVLHKLKDVGITVIIQVI